MAGKVDALQAIAETYQGDARKGGIFDLVSKEACHAWSIWTFPCDAPQCP
jgi:hypothetical protein